MTAMGDCAAAVAAAGEELHIAADCAADVTVVSGLTKHLLASCVHEVVSDIQYETPWQSCTIEEVPFESCTIYEIPWTSDC